MGQIIDEEMIPFKGQSVLRQTMKNKPVKPGFKIWTCCCSRGFPFIFEKDHGARFGKEQRRFRNNEAAERVVADVCQPLTEQGHVVAFDRFFTSIAFLEKFQENGVNAIGTILSSRVNKLFITKKE
jgi:hypothetical protein